MAYSAVNQFQSMRTAFISAPQSSASLSTAAFLLLASCVVRRKAEEMFFDLNASDFEVVLIPATEPRHTGHKIRALQSGNPVWYQQLCAEHRSIRGIGPKRYKRPRTYIGKKTVLSTLEQIMRGNVPAGLYGERMMRVIEREIFPRNDAPGEFGDTWEFGF